MYIVTLARVLPSTLDAGALRDVEALSRADVLAAVRDAWDILTK